MSRPRTGAARLFRADERTSRRWASGDRAVPPTVEILLELLLQGTLRVRDLERISLGRRPRWAEGERKLWLQEPRKNGCIVPHEKGRSFQ
jgi:hypothetical protein